MRKYLLLFSLVINFSSFAQNGWTLCNTPPGIVSRIDDIFMVNAQVGYAGSGDGMIMKTTDGGNNWSLIKKLSTNYIRSVEFINEQTGFIGAFHHGVPDSILLKTIDGGASWIDLTPQLSLRARDGICGLAIADANTIYGCGNWYKDSAYIIKSTDGGTTWSEINMASLATSIIDLNFTNKDTGFAVGKGKLPSENGVILYTTDGGLTWLRVYTGDRDNQYCWKIQRLDAHNYFVSVQDLGNTPPKVLRSVNGGFTWTKLNIVAPTYNIEGIGFIDSLHGWTGGDKDISFETNDGGKTWNSIPVCPYMNRVIRLNDSTMFASGKQIWKFKGTFAPPPPPPPPPPVTQSLSLNCHPNPVNGMLTIDLVLPGAIRIVLMLLDESGQRVKVIDNSERAKGPHKFSINTAGLSQGIYYVSLMTHEDKITQKIIVGK